ncbi:restriction endonuclease subunit S [Streptomyces sp. NPDC000349]|uniref:restriction endonuclease subunit S n=1 Tax=unclassified Streptomyces TaxID=2593676 RepID=UPI0027D8C5AB|nr:restriction endonuclease subunit S [Streptomyces sp. DSM 40167]
MTESRLAPWLSASRWPTAPIRLVARLGSGHTPSRSKPEYWNDCTVPWITLADVWQIRDGRTKVITETKEKVSLLGLANSAAVRHPAGTVILSRTASVGFSAIMGCDMATSQDFATWTCGPKLEPRYLLHALRGMAPDLKRVATGSTHKTIYMPDIEQLRVPLPPREEQRRIADFLDAETARIDRLIQLQCLTMNKLDEREMAQLDSAVDELLDRWGTVPLRRFLRSVDQGTSPQADAFPAGPDEWGVLKVSSLRPGRFFPDANKRLPADLQPDVKNEVRAGDLLITRANTPQLVGSTAVVPQTRGKLLLSDKIFRVLLDQRITAEFVAMVARGSRIRGLCSASSNGASQSMANIRFEEVKAWPIPAATLDAQHEVVKQFDQQRSALDELRTMIERQISLLTERRQALITAAVTGQFDVATASGRNVAEGVTV